MRVGKDRASWQELECYLFTEMLICVKEKKNGTTQPQLEDPRTKRKLSRCTLKGSILIKKHLRDMDSVPGIYFLFFFWLLLLFCYCYCFIAIVLLFCFVVANIA